MTKQEEGVYLSQWMIALFFFWTFKPIFQNSNLPCTPSFWAVWKWIMSLLKQLKSKSNSLTVPSCNITDERRQATAFLFNDILKSLRYVQCEIRWLHPMDVVKLQRQPRLSLPVTLQMNVVKLQRQARWSLPVASQITSLSYSVKFVDFFLLHHRWTSSKLPRPIRWFLPVASQMNVVKLQRQIR